MPSFSHRTDSSLQRIRVTVFLFAIVVVLGVISFVYFRSSYQTRVNTIPTNQAIIEESVKTEFGTKAPDDFPTNIPLEAGVTFDQSYSLDYSDQKQLTAVFVSKEAIKKNYDLYNEFFKKEGWVVTSQFESESVSSLYALKEKNEMNVTVSKSESGLGSQVSISVLKK